MKKLYFVVFILFFVIQLSAQNSTIVFFTDKATIKKIEVENDANISEAMKKEVADIVANGQTIYKMTFSAQMLFFESIGDAKDIKVGSKPKTKRGAANIFSINYTMPSTKIIKNLKTGFYEKVYNGKTTKNKVATPKWIITKTSKKILNYKCNLATTVHNGKPLEVYYTSEIKGNASPHTYPFINGVILEYKTPTRYGIASDIKFNQPNIIEKDFFK